MGTHKRRVSEWRASRCARWICCLAALSAVAVCSPTGAEEDGWTQCPTWEQWTKENALDHASAELARKLCGAWRFVDGYSEGPDAESPESTPRTGLRVFAPGYYSVMRMVTDRPLYASAFPVWDPTDDEKVANNATFMANTGTWSVAGDTLTARIVVAKWPNYVGKETRFRCTVTGDTLRLEFRAPTNPDIVESETWVRARPAKGGI